MLITLENYQTVIQEYVKRNELHSITLKDYFEKVESGLAPNMSSFEMSRYCSEVAASMITIHPEFDRLAAFILMSFHHETTSSSFSEKIAYIQKSKKILHPEKVELIQNNAEIIDKMIVYERDFSLNYFGAVSMLKSYT